MWQAVPAEMKDSPYQVVNLVIQNGRMPTSWEGALTTLIPKKVGEEKILESIRLICLMNTAANSNERLGQTTLQKPGATVGFRMLAGGFPARQIHTATDFTLC